MIRWVLLWWVASACAGSAQRINSGQPAVAEAGTGFLVLGIDTDVGLSYIQFVLEDDPSTELIVSDPQAAPIQVYRTSPGRYCMASLVGGHVARTGRKSPCIVVRAGQATYGGHLQIRGSDLKLSGAVRVAETCQFMTQHHADLVESLKKTDERFSSCSAPSE